MTPEGKAQMLIRSMLSKNPNIQDGTSIIDVIQAKLCALVTVNEILDDYSYMQNVRNANSNQIHSRRVYWQEVKQEIEKL